MLKDQSQSESVEVNNLPTGWASATLDVVLESLESGSRPKGGVRGIMNGIPSIGGEHLNNDGKFNFENIKFIPESFFEEMTRGHIRKHDVLVVKDGATTGKISYVAEAFPFEKAAINEHVFILRGNSKVILQPYLFIYLFSYQGQNLIKSKISGSAQGGINTSFIQDFFIPIPPINEQRRIVSKIEEFFSDIDSMVNSLKKTRAQLMLFRTASLKSAFEGKLTARWRREHSNKVESAQRLLTRIIEWKIRTSKDNLKELMPLNRSELRKLPEGWEWTRIDVISRRIQYGSSEKAIDKSGGLPVLRMGNIVDGRIVFDNLKYYPINWPHAEEFLLQDGDVLFNRTNSAELVGKTAVYRSHYPKAIFASYLIRVNINEEFYLPEILSHYINSIFGRQYISSVSTQQVGQANVNGTKLAMMPIPLPPFEEQKQIVNEIENGFFVALNTEKLIDSIITKTEKLQQSILKMAFEGKLVKQDPNDESASLLLESIKKEKRRLRNN